MDSDFKLASEPLPLDKLTLEVLLDEEETYLRRVTAILLDGDSPDWLAKLATEEQRHYRRVSNILLAYPRKIPAQKRSQAA